MDNHKEKNYIPVKISEEAEVYIEVTEIGQGQDIAFDKFDFDNIEKSIVAISNKFSNAISKIKPDKASVEFGIDVAVESGNLTSLIVKGEGKSNFKITLEWTK